MELRNSDEELYVPKMNTGKIFLVCVGVNFKLN